MPTAIRFAVRLLFVSQSRFRPATSETYKACIQGIQIRHTYTYLLFVKPPRIAFIKFVRLLVVAKALLFLVPGICRHDVHEDLRPRFAL